MIERKIIIGLIVSTDYMKSIHPIWDTSLLKSSTAKQLAIWCWEYFDKYTKSPGKDIEGIFYSKINDASITDSSKDDIENILDGLADEYEKSNFNYTYLIDETKKYFTGRKLEIHTELIKSHLVTNELGLAEQIACDYKPIPSSYKNEVDLSSTTVLTHIDDAFMITNKNILSYPGLLGKFWNDQMVRGGLIAFLAPEKRGKTFLLIDMAMHACRQHRRVAFFQAGDLTESTFLKRICIYLAWRSDKEKYCQSHYQPTKDCIRNQMNECDLPDRTCDFGPFDGMAEDDVREIPMNELIEAYAKHPKYRPCSNCEMYGNPKKRLGVAWLKKVRRADPLTSKQARKMIENFFVLNKRQFKVSTYANDTLTIAQIRAKLDVWEKEDDFVPDLIIIDYADLLVPERKMEFRHQQNEIWKGLRRLSQEKGQPLVITATQSDANSYEKGRLRLSNFSEDKRKYGHVTAFYGLNQDPKGREKAVGIMRINELILREDDYDTSREITVLQNLRRGRPCLTSYW